MSEGKKLEPVVLEGNVVRLEPMTAEHHDRLTEIGLDPELWRFTVTAPRTAADMREYMEGGLKTARDGTGMPFVTIEKASGHIVGSTRFASYDPFNHRVEIGWTWIAKPWQRTAVNTEAKYLMMSHAFEQLGCVRVELKTDVRNEQSRNAMLRIGAREEGVFRKHMLLSSGGYRDSIYFSVLDDEWPAVKARLETFMKRRVTSERE